MRIVAVSLAIAASYASRPAYGAGIPGCTRYLLLDDRVIESTVNAELAVGTVTKHGRNPLFGEDKPWEKRFDNLYGNVIYDAEERLYKCWYSPFIVDHSAKGMTLAQRQARYRPPRGREMAICYATSDDGIRWEKPALGLVKYDGSTSNNIIWRGPHGAGVFWDGRDPDLQRRYKTIFKGLRTSTSADGLHWADAVKCQGVRVRGDTHNNAFWAPTLERYVGITRTWGERGREVARIESRDFSTWTPATVVMRGTTKDRQPYAMPVFHHAGVYLGLVAIHEQRPVDRVWTELAWSPDTVEWHRISEGTPLIPCGEKELAYDYGCVYACAVPVFLDNEIRLYYGASDYLHTGWRNGSLALATLRPDGFAGYRPRDNARSGKVTTVPMACLGKTIGITADVAPGGSVRIRAIGPDDTQISEARAISTTVTDQVVAFEPAISTDEVRLVIEFTNATVFSFVLLPNQ